MAPRHRHVIPPGLLLAGVLLITACTDRPAESFEPLQAVGTTMPRVVAESIYAALADSLRNAYGDVPEYLAANAVRLDPRSADISNQPGEPLPAWALQALRQRRTFAGVCTIGPDGACPEASEVVLVFQVSRLYLKRGTDTVLVGVSQFTTDRRGLRDNKGYSFGAYAHFFLARMSGAWQVVRVELRVIS